MNKTRKPPSKLFVQLHHFENRSRNQISIGLNTRWSSGEHLDGIYHLQSAVQMEATA